MGYVALTARDNINLEETTDREGFINNPYYRNFYRLLQEFKGFTSITHEFLGRSWSEFRSSRKESLIQLDSRKTVEDISISIRKGLSKAPKHKTRVESLTNRLTSSLTISKDLLYKLRTAKEFTPVLKNKVIDVLSELETAVEDAKKEVSELSEYLIEIGEYETLGEVLQERVVNLKRQRDDLYETVALGLTAEALSHEVFNVADQLAKRTRILQTQVRKSGISDNSLLVFIEYVQSAISALRKSNVLCCLLFRNMLYEKHNIEMFKFIANLENFTKKN